MRLRDDPIGMLAFAVLIAGFVLWPIFIMVLIFTGVLVP